MNYPIRFITTLLFFVLVTDVYGQWIADASISGGPVSKIKHLGNDVFLLSSENLFKSSDLGQTWEFLNGIPEAISDFDLNNENGLIIAITKDYPNKIYLSEDEGNSWELVGHSDEEFIQLSAKSIFTYRSNLNRSNDFGQSWEEIFNQPGTPGITTDLATIGDTLFLGTGFQDVGYGLQRSNNNGDNWDRVDLPGSPDRIYQVDTFDSLVYVSARGSNGTYVVRSGDYGSSWTNIGEVAPGIYEYYDLDASGDTLVACDYDKLRASFDGGISWSGLNLPHFENWNPVVSLMLMGPHLFIGTQNGIFYSNNMGSTWEKRSEGIYSGQFWIYYKKTMESLFMIRDARLFKKNLNTFDLVPLPSSNEMGNVHAVGNLLLVTHYDNSGYQGTLFDYYVSFDEGLTFSKLDLPRDQWLSGILLHDDHYIMSMQGSIYRSSDAISWEKVYSSENQYGSIDQICELNNEIFGMDFQQFNGLVSSKDDGTSWGLIRDTPLDTLYIQSIGSSPNYLYLTWSYEKEISYNNYRVASGVYRYNGLEWELIQLYKDRVYHPQLYVDDTFIGLLSEGSILFSNDSGDSFKNFRIGFNSNRIEPMEVVTFQDSVRLILDGGGAWKRSMNEMNFTPIPIPNSLHGIYDGQSITLAWEAEAGSHNGFIIERSPLFLNEYDRVGKEVNEYTDIDSDLEEKYRLTYRVFSYDDEGWSVPSESFTLDYYNYYITNLDEEGISKNSKIYPNPAKNELYLESRERGIKSLMIYDILGNVFDTNQIRLSENLIRTDLNSIPRHLLIIVVTFTDGSKEYHRIIRYK